MHFIIHFLIIHRIQATNYFYKMVIHVRISKKQTRPSRRLEHSYLQYHRAVPNVNPIESIFHLLQKRLDAQALNEKIIRENFIKFSASVKNTLQIFPLHTINKIIESMNTKMSMIIKCKGERIKY